MRSDLLCLAALLCSLSLAGAQSTNPHHDPSDFQPPINRGEGIIGGKNDAHKLEREEEQPNTARPSAQFDRAQIKRDADELSRLAQSISSEIGDTQNGTLPKDLNDNLKKLQKLSKRLRDELRL